MLNLPDFQNCKVGILGLGYVGLPLALQIAKTFKCKKSNKKLNRFVVGFDINKTRINELKIKYYYVKICQCNSDSYDTIF